MIIINIINKRIQILKGMGSTFFTVKKDFLKTETKMLLAL